MIVYSNNVRIHTFTPDLEYWANELIACHSQSKKGFAENFGLVYIADFVSLMKRAPPKPSHILSI